jgi:Flp pilus assembly protein TadD
VIVDATVPAIVRATAASLLQRTPGPEVAAALAAAAADASPLVRRGAAEGSAGLPEEQRRGLLAGLLADPVRSVRIDAAHRLAGAQGFAGAEAARLATALREARACATLAASQPDGLSSLGRLAAQSGDLEEGERCYREVLRRTPDYPPAAVNLADLLRTQERDSDALAVLDQALRAAPGSAALHHARGLALVRLRRMPEAGAALARALLEAPRDPSVALARALWLDSSGETALARSVMEQALVAQPYDVELLLALAALAERVGDLGAAAAALARLEALLPWDVGIQSARARLERAPARKPR